MITLYRTDALPYHYIAKDSSGGLWLIPAAVMGERSWRLKKPYNGSYDLELVPEYIAKFYQPGPSERIVSVAAAASLLGVTEQRVRALIADGRLPATKTGRDWAIMEHDLDLVRERKTGRPKGQ